MSGFQDAVARDIGGVFLNMDFFAEMYRVEGKEIPIVVDNDELKERQGGQDLAVAESATLFYARTTDLPPRRPAGESLNINGREMHRGRLAGRHGHEHRCAAAEHRRVTEVGQ